MEMAVELGRKLKDSKKKHESQSLLAHSFLAPQGGLDKSPVTQENFSIMLRESKAIASVVKEEADKHRDKFIQRQFTRGQLKKLLHQAQTALQKRNITSDEIRKGQVNFNKHAIRADGVTLFVGSFTMISTALAIYFRGGIRELLIENLEAGIASASVMAVGGVVMLLYGCLFMANCHYRDVDKPGASVSLLPFVESIANKETKDEFDKKFVEAFFSKELSIKNAPPAVLLYPSIN